MANNKPEEAINTYEKGTRRIPAGMLSSPHIEYCVDEYNIIDKFKKSCLGPATYHMRLGGKVLTWEQGKKVEYILGEKEDKIKNIRNKLELRPNSLTFVTTIEKFNLTKDIIARFNLKSIWVHEGLLLGTGPIVDPELKANLLIPLHNFSSQPVYINYGEKIISVEFTKTLNPSDSFQLSNGKIAKYKKNESRNFDFDKYRNRIGRKKVESSVLRIFEDYDKIFEKNERHVKRFSWIGGITIFSTFIGLIVLVFLTWQIIESAHEKIDTANNIIKQYKENSFDFRTFASKSAHDDLRKEFFELKRYTERLNTESYLNSDKFAVDFKKMQDQYEKKIKSIELKISELEKKEKINPILKPLKSESN